MDFGPMDFFSFGGSVVVTPPIPDLYDFDSTLEDYLADQLEVPVWALYIPQRSTTYPQIVVTPITSDNEYLLRGSSTGLVSAEYQIDCYSDSDKVAAKALSERVRFLLQGFRGYMGGIFVSSCRLRNRYPVYEATDYGNDQGTWRYLNQYDVMYNESIPEF